ncbi:YDG/SRA domain-containing protein [Deinococcus malanensis]|uniref:YDG/SRA domain-containing protein n=1 Tax=Deinococcus malanensis TaxID=1706855 RepID=UPI001668C189|nr:YDG/SRA domain-containing protein [Deinococcus malanensis]
MSTRHFGAIPGVPEGATFASRQELRDAKVHPPTQAGISGSGFEGADSIVLSGGYEDDHDEGDVIVYTGEGGRDPATGKQVAHQELVRGNLALALNHRDGLPLRVTRGSRHRSPFSPLTGYQYSGLYRVEDHWQELGRSGYRIWRFRLVKVEVEESFANESAESGSVIRRATVVQRIIRDTAVARAIKVLYDYQCQICGTRLETSEGPYAEAAHIRPLGSPHDGPDSASNLLCLCPNHHVLFDHGGLAVQDNFDLIGYPGRLQIHGRHQIDLACVQYHRERYSPLIRGRRFHNPTPVCRKAINVATNSPR